MPFAVRAIAVLLRSNRSSVSASLPDCSVSVIYAFQGSRFWRST